MPLKKEELLRIRETDDQLNLGEDGRPDLSRKNTISATGSHKNFKNETLGVMWERLHPGKSLYSELAGFDTEGIGFVSIEALKRVLDWPNHLLQKVLNDPCVGDWIIKEKNVVNYEGITVVANCQQIVGRFPLASLLFRQNPVLRNGEQARSFLSRFDSRKNGILLKDELVTAFSFAFSMDPVLQQDILAEFIQQIQDSMMGEVEDSSVTSRSNYSDDWEETSTTSSQQQQQQQEQQQQQFPIEQLIEHLSERKMPSRRVLTLYSIRILRKTLMQSMCDGLANERLFQIIDRDNDGVISRTDLFYTLVGFGFPKLCHDDQSIVEKVWNDIFELQGEGCSSNQLHHFIVCDQGKPIDQEESMMTEQDKTQRELEAYKAQCQALQARCQCETELSKINKKRVDMMKQENILLRQEMERVQAQLKEQQQKMNEAQLQVEAPATAVGPKGTDSFYDLGDIYDFDLESKDGSASARLDPHPQKKHKLTQMYREYSHDALVIRLCKMHKEIEHETNVNGQLSERVKQLEAANQALQTRCDSLEKGHMEMEDTIRLLEKENKTLSKLRINGTGVSTIVTTPRRDDKDKDDRNAFWKHLLILSESCPGALIRSAALAGDTYTVASIIAAAEERGTVLLALKLVFEQDKITGDNCLHMACRNGSPELVKILVELARQNGMRMDQANQAGKTPVQLARELNHFDAERALESTTFDRDIARTDSEFALLTPLMISAAKDDILHFSALLRNHDHALTINHTSVNGCTALFFAAFCDDDEIEQHEDRQANAKVKLLLEAGADVHVTDAKGWTVFHYAMHWGLNDIFASCARQATDLDHVQWSHILYLAIKSGQNCADLALDWLERKHEQEFIDKVICGVSPNQMTPLMIACDVECAPFVQTLLERGKHIKNFVNLTSPREKVSPLQLACARGNIEIVKMLLSENADINHRDLTGESPFFKAAIGNHVELCFHLLTKHKPFISKSERNMLVDKHQPELGLSTQIVKLIDDYLQSGILEQVRRRLEHGWLPELLKRHHHHTIVNQEQSRYVVANPNVFVMRKRHDDDDDDDDKDQGKEEPYHGRLIKFLNDEIAMVEIKVPGANNTTTIHVNIDSLNHTKGVCWEEVEDVTVGYDENDSNYFIAKTSKNEEIHVKHTSLIRPKPTLLEPGTIVGVQLPSSCSSSSETDMKKKKKRSKQIKATIIDAYADPFNAFEPVYSIEYGKDTTKTAHGIKSGQICKVHKKPVSAAGVIKKGKKRQTMRK